MAIFLDAKTCEQTINLGFASFHDWILTCSSKCWQHINWAWQIVVSLIQGSWTL
jgi:hypothetical protein